MSKWIFILFFSLFGVSSAQAGCMTKHLNQAIDLNYERLPLYSKLSGGKSQRISKALISSEKWAKLVSWRIDQRARKFQKKGINIVCDEFIEMDHTPEFKERFDFEPDPISDFHTLDPRVIKATIREALKSDDYLAVRDFALSLVEALKLKPTYNCMTRHVLESLARVAALAPVHNKKLKTWGFVRP